MKHTPLAKGDMVESKDHATGGIVGYVWQHQDGDLMFSFQGDPDDEFHADMFRVLVRCKGLSQEEFDQQRRDAVHWLDRGLSVTTPHKPRMGTRVRDKEGDVWRWGRTRWSCEAPIDGVRVFNVGRLPTSELLNQYGPVTEIES